MTVECGNRDSERMVYFIFLNTYQLAEDEFSFYGEHYITQNKRDCSFNVIIGAT